MTLRIAALTFRIQRFETLVIVGATLLSLLVSVAVIGWVNGAGYDRCLIDQQLSTTAFCNTTVSVWLFRVARLSASIVPFFPVVAGLLAGGPVVAREIESGTARLAWSLGPSRLRWFVHRAVPPLMLTLLAGLVIGWTADALIHLVEPLLDLDQTFAAFRQRGLLIGVQALLVASIALAVGALLGRSVPTFIVALVLFGGLLIGTEKVEAVAFQREALTTTSFSYDAGDLVVGNAVQLPDGSIVSYEELIALHPEIAEFGYSPDQYPNVTYYIPGSRYHEIERREALALTAVAVLFTVLAAATVARRRPR